MSYDFDGSGSANLNVATPITTVPLTVACWFKVDTDAEAHVLTCLGNGTDSEIMRLSASFDGTGDPLRFRATTTGGTQSNIDSTTGASLSTWHHACMVAASSSNRSVYLDGGSKATVASGTRTISGATLFAIGAQYQAGTYSADTNGKIAHVAIWDIALSDAEVAQLAAGDNPLTVQSGNLIAYWPLTADLVDLVGALTLTNGGGATFDGADNPTVDAPPSDSITPAEMASVSVMESPSISVAGSVSPAEMVSTSAIGSPILTSLVLEPDDEDSDSYDVTTTEVIGSTIYLEGYYDGSGFGGWVNTNCRVSGGVDGATYNVVLDATGKQTAGTPPGNNNTTGSPWTPIVRFKVAGVWGAWSKLSSYSYNSTTKVITGSFTWATGATEARIAYKPVVTVAELDAFREEIYTSPHAIEPPSSVAASSLPEGVHARITHGTGPNTVASGTVDLWCARVGTGPFVGTVVFAEHAQEDVGDLSTMQFVRWMLGASSEAADFRSRFSVYVYVHNLSGRKCGRTRYNQDATGSDEDPNREWDSSASDQTTAVKAAIELDFPVASVDLSFMLAYHGQQDANVNTAAYDIYTTTEFTADQEFHSRIATAIGSQVHQQDTSPPTTGTSKWFGHVTRSAPLSLTLEHADAATGYPDAATMHDAFAAATGEILIELASEGYLGAIPVTPAEMASTSVMESPSISVLTSAQPGEMISLSAMEAPSIGAGGSAMPSRMVSVSVMEAPALSAYGSVQSAEMASANVMSSPSFTSYGFVPPVPAGRTGYSLPGNGALKSRGAPTIGHSVN